MSNKGVARLKGMKSIANLDSIINFYLHMHKIQFETAAAGIKDELSNGHGKKAGNTKGDSSGKNLNGNNINGKASGQNKNIEERLKEELDEINSAVERVVEKQGFEAEAEGLSNINAADSAKEKEIRIRYAAEESLKIDYGEIFSYLDTRPNTINYEYGFSDKIGTEDSELTPMKIASINQIKRYEKACYSRDSKHEAPDGVGISLYEAFRLYSQTFEGFVMNIFYFENAFASPPG